jgi:hypothetical protein
MNTVALGNVYNMDQTMVRFDSPSSRTNNQKGAPQVRIVVTGGQKKGFTVVLCTSGIGEKLPAFTVLKKAAGRLPLRVAQQIVLPHNVIARASTNGWMTATPL